MNVPLKYVNFEISMQNTVYKFRFYEKVEGLDKIIKRLEKGLKKSEYYVREDNGIISIIAPHHQQIP